MREYPEYRQVLSALYERFNKGWLTISDIAEYDHCDPRTVRTRYRLPHDAKGIDIAILAARKCELAN